MENLPFGFGPPVMSKIVILGGEKARNPVQEMVEMIRDGLCGPCSKKFRLCGFIPEKIDPESPEKGHMIGCKGFQCPK